MRRSIGQSAFEGVTTKRCKGAVVLELSMDGGMAYTGRFVERSDRGEGEKCVRYTQRGVGIEIELAAAEVSGSTFSSFSPSLGPFSSNISG